MSKPIRVFIADDHAIVRKGIRALLSTEPDVEVVGEAGDGSIAVEQVLTLRPDVTLMDLVLPGAEGAEVIANIRAIWPEARILVLTSFVTDEKVLPAIRAGARGYLLKDSSPEDLVRAIRQVDRGESPLDPSVAGRIMNALSQPVTAEPGVDALTARELDVLREVARGYSNQEIAARLSLSEATVRTHISHVLSKLGLASRTQATLYALREGFVTLED
ncbi:MAG: response regulator transcription factor [Thermomicrobiales bacterium]|nr:MAG: response regulator transcription factor [Thermomicrobiales bacterium]